MFFRKKRTDHAIQIDSVTDLFKKLEKVPDFIHFEHKGKDFTCWISFIQTLVDVEYLHRDVFPYLYSDQTHNLTEVQDQIPTEKVIRTKDLSLIQSRLLDGYTIIQESEKKPDCLIIPSVKIKGREIEKSENETSVLGPREAFVESADLNINLIRKRIPIPQFMFEDMRIGKISKTRICVIYIDGIANKDNIQTVKQRIHDLEITSMIDSTMLALMISDNNNSIFPQFIDTERPDRVAGALYEGKIAVIVDGSPNALILPASIIEFFVAFDDYFLVWPIATAYRLLRLFAVAFSVISSSVYVAILTYHYQLIPDNLIPSLFTSRTTIPYAPLSEVLVLEIMIELLREAVARLPTKVGQTIGIVGGIVVGTASVQAGIVSNFLLIIIALSALSAFITPNYRMAATIRFIRFPFILSAQILGLLGISLCFLIFVNHLTRLTSLGRPYIEPIYPTRISDLKDAFIRLPLNFQNMRPLFLRPSDSKRFNNQRAHEKVGPKHSELDD
ncbi:spore germination protein [Sporolactobacillus shoreicorticis]|uniref:spore germination protein n=1 Tax=Sporolactobacillus shoreicorticis TaxID=1923877 RepID=UPI0020981999|nr:spore germination protein [Sporolactobacillus shoreicorticis]MCO7124646.1 spore germination protein [Sporolactobacillus shoreicorticis]